MSSLAGALHALTHNQTQAMGSRIRAVAFLFTNDLRTFGRGFSFAFGGYWYHSYFTTLSPSSAAG